jgi:hypothetical protein
MHIIIAFGICISFAAIIFGSFIWMDAQELRRLKQRNKEIRQQYAELRIAMVREMEQRVSVANFTSTVPPVLSVTMSPGATPLGITTTSTAPVITAAAQLQTRNAPYTPPQPPESAESHFTRIALPRRFIKLD